MLNLTAQGSREIKRASVQNPASRCLSFLPCWLGGLFTHRHYIRADNVMDLYGAAPSFSSELCQIIRWVDPLRTEGRNWDIASWHNTEHNLAASRCSVWRSDETWVVMIFFLAAYLAKTCVPSFWNYRKLPYFIAAKVKRLPSIHSQLRVTGGAGADSRLLFRENSRDRQPFMLTFHPGLIFLTQGYHSSMSYWGEEEQTPTDDDVTRQVGRQKVEWRAEEPKSCLVSDFFSRFTCLGLALSYRSWLLWLPWLFTLRTVSHTVCFCVLSNTLRLKARWKDTKLIPGVSWCDQASACVDVETTMVALLFFRDDN